MSACRALVRQARAAGVHALIELTRHADPFARQGAARTPGELDNAGTPARERLHCPEVAGGAERQAA